MVNREIIEKIINGPLVLLLGQNYLLSSSEGNIFLKEIFRKYTSSNMYYEPSYNNLLKLGLEKNIEDSALWISKLSQYIHPSPQIARIASIPWAAVYTSSIDPVVNNLFDTDWRTTQLICDTRYRINDPRNKLNLHITKLYGCLSRQDSDQRAPLTLLEKSKRQYVANTLLQRLPETVTTKGLLVIEGYTVADWVDIEQSLYPTLSQLGEGQILFCNFSEELSRNDFLNDLIDNGKIIPYVDSFADIVSNLENEGQYKITTPEFEERFAKYIRIGDKKVKVPKDLYRDISKSAIVLDDQIFNCIIPGNPDDKYHQFKEFLSKTSIHNLWSGYPKGFAFKRDYYEKLKSIVIDKLNFNYKKNYPIILHGQSGGGKTVSLGNLAYELQKEYRLPILFIEKQYNKIDEQQIDRFCLWAQEQGARGTVIVWDGMIEVDFYYSLLDKLEARGRNIIIIGSTYALKKENVNTIASLTELSGKERTRFRQYIKDIDLILSNIITAEESNILSMFYRYLPDSRSNIQQGLRSEFEHFKDLIKTYVNNTGSRLENKPTMYHVMEQAGLIKSEAYDEEHIQFEQEEEIDGETVTLADKLIYSIMVPGQFGIEVPFELLIRNVGFSTVSSTPFHLLNMVNIITWIEDNIGNVSLGPRTAMEARILTKYLGGKRAQLEYIKSLLSSVSSTEFLDDGMGYESNREIEFAVNILYNISPNGPNANLYSENIYEITEVLKNLREGNFAYHPRLILKEASFLREIVKNGWQKGEETNQELLERAEDIVREALDKLGDFGEMVITNYLRVELASILGSKTVDFIGEGDVDNAKSCYSIVLSISSPNFASNPNNYGALDVLSWTTIRLLKSNFLNEKERLEVQASLLNVFEISETEGVSSQHYEDFNGRKLTLLEIMGSEKLSEDLFTRMIKEGSTTGYFIRTLNILNASKDSDLSNESLILKYTNAYMYLQQFESKIQDDGRCLFLLFRCWWVMNAKSYPLSDEKKTVPFDREKWEYCLSLTEKITFCPGWEKIAVVLFVKGIAEFHLNLMPDMSTTFRALDILTDFSSYGSRRIVKSYLASTAEGYAKSYSGEVCRNYSIGRGDRFGEIYINDLKINIRFSLYEFQQTLYRRGEIIRNFKIGFNFRGPLAVFSKND